MALDPLAHQAALVESVQKDKGALRRESLPQHAVERRGVLQAEEAVHPVPRRSKRIGTLEQARLEPLHLDQDGHHLRVE
eukprot:7391214-Prymnesium_polylepis.1